jgi:hypothetical protein
VKTAKVSPEPGELQAPLVHLNGTGGAYLLEALKDAGSAVSKAREALSLTYPNKRDFYPLGVDDAAWVRARDEANARALKLEEVDAELDALAHAVAAQMEALT